MILKEARHEMIMQILNEKHFSTLSYIVEKTGIPLSTLRRDLDELAESGKLIKLRGGAALNNGYVQTSTSTELYFDDRATRNTDEKQRIAVAAMDYIKSGDTIILDCGTTVFELSKKIAQTSTIDNLMIATNDLRSAIELADHPSVKLIVIGGNVRNRNYSLVGYFGENVLEQIHADVSFISVDAIDLEHGLMAFSVEEMGIKRNMLRTAREVVVLADHTKFDAIAFVKIASLYDIDCIITGNELDEHFVKELRALGIKLVLV